MRRTRANQRVRRGAHLCIHAMILLTQLLIVHFYHLAGNLPPYLLSSCVSVIAVQPKTIVLSLFGDSDGNVFRTKLWWVLEMSSHSIQSGSNKSQALALHQC